MDLGPAHSLGASRLAGGDPWQALGRLRKELVAFPARGRGSSALQCGPENLGLLLILVA